MRLRRKLAHVPVRWSQVLRHPDDIKQNKAASRARQLDRQWTESVCEPGRVYDALNVDTGIAPREHNRAKLQAIAYDKTNGRWKHATYVEVTQQSNSTKQVTQDTRERHNAYVNRHVGGSV